MLFAWGIGAFLVSDLIYSVLAVQGSYSVGPVDFGLDPGLHAVGCRRPASVDGDRRRSWSE